MYFGVKCPLQLSHCVVWSKLHLVEEMLTCPIATVTLVSLCSLAGQSDQITAGGGNVT